MAIANADGSIILSTKLDTSGVSKGLGDIKNKFAALRDQKATLATLTQAIKDQSYVIKQLSIEHANLVAKGKGTSEQAVELKGRIDTLTAEMKEMQAAATTLGTKATTAFTTMRTALMRFASYFIGIQTIFAAFRFSGEAAKFYAQTEAGATRLVEIYGEASDAVGNFIDQNSKAIGLSKAAAAQFAASYGNIFSAFADQKTNAELTNEFLNLTAVIASKTGRSLEETQEKIKSGLFGNLRAIDDLGIFVRQTALESSEAFRKLAGDRSWDELSSEEQQQIRAYAIMEQGVEKYGKEVLETTTLTRAKFNAAYQDFQNSWGNIVNTVLIPVLQVLTQIFTIATSGLNALSGRSGKILEDTEVITDNSEDTAENIEEQTDAQKSLNKEMKKTLAGFDDIQILSAQTAENTSGGSLDSGLKGIGGDSGGTTPDGSDNVSAVNETLTAIMGIVALSLVAVGLILLFTGNIGWGIGFIIAGAATLTVTMASASEFGYDGIIQMLTTIMGVAGGALLALGIILLWIGGVVGTPIAIGMIISGGALIVSAVAAQAAFAPDDIAAWLSLIMGIAGGALLALGVILCMVGSFPLGVGMIIAGAVSLVSAVALNSEAVVEAIQGPLGVIMAIAGAALLVLGIILTCTGNLILGIPLIALGAAALVTPIALNWNAIVDWVKGAWEAVKDFWNKYIAPVFTARFWLDLAKTCGNGLIAGFEGAINGIIWLFESLINFVVDGLNSFIGGISTVTGAIGDLIGINLRIPEIPRANLGRVSIPRLAQGTVVPPNKEFMAILGDNTKEHEIVSPVSTMKQAFMEAMIEMGGGFGGGNTEVVLEIDGRELGRAIVEQGDKEMRRIGTRLVVT